MKEKLRRSKEQLAQGFDAYSLVLITVFWKKNVYIYLLGSDKQFFIIGKVKIERVSHELKVKYGVLKSARGMVLTLFVFGFFTRIESFLNDSYRYFIFAVGKESCGKARKVLSQSYLHTKPGACEDYLSFMFIYL